MPDSLIHKFKALSDETRLRIVLLLSHGEMSVGEIMQVLQQSQPRVSRHLKLLVEAGLCERSPEGGQMFYRLSRGAPVSNLTRLIEEFINFNDIHIRQDHQRLRELHDTRSKTAQEYLQADPNQWDRVKSSYFNEAKVEEFILSFVKGCEFKYHLDVGTGAGRALQLFKSTALEGMGIDISRKMLHRARSSLYQAGLRNRFVRQGDAANLPLDDEHADLVTLIEVLHFLPNPLACLSECIRVLAPQGLLVIVDFEFHQNEVLRTDHNHHHLGFSRQQIGIWLESFKLSIKAFKVLEPENQQDGLKVLTWIVEKQ